MRCCHSLVMLLVLFGVSLAACAPSIDSEMAAILEAMPPACRGQGVPEAASYDGGSGPRPMVLLSSSGEQHQWSGSLPDEWTPSAVSDVELVVCVGSETEVLIQTCPYIGGPPIDRFVYQMAIRVVAAQTGEEIASGVVSGDPPRACRQSEPVDLVRLEGDHVAFGDVGAWLQSTLAAQTYPSPMPTPGTGAFATSPTFAIAPTSAEAVPSVPFSPEVATAVALGNASPEAPPGLEVAHILEGHEGGVTGVAWSPDDRFLAAAAGSGAITLWNTQAWTPLRDLVGHTTPIMGLRWSPAGAALASGAEDGTVILWDVSSGGRLQTLEGHSSLVIAVEWSPDECTVASGAADNRVILWDTASGEQLHVLEGHAWPVVSLAWSPDGQRLASGGADGAVILWNPITGENLRTLVDDIGVIRQLVWSSDGATLTAAGFDSAMGVRIDVETGSSLGGWFLPMGWSAGTALSPDGTMLAATREDGAVELWRLETMESILLSGGDGPLSCVAWSQDGTMLAAGADGGSALVWLLAQ